MRTFCDPDFGAYVLCQENALGQEAQSRYYGAGGGNVAELRYCAGVCPDFRFTGQREGATIGLYFYNARCGACPEGSEGTPCSAASWQQDTGNLRLQRAGAGGSRQPGSLSLCRPDQLPRLSSGAPLPAHAFHPRRRPAMKGVWPP